ncbi:MAG: hypothetical protein SOW08_08460 [Lachnospiraceae bacterium]|nr:hypothetical protein [Lachnospiraceae bacterium]
MNAEYDRREENCRKRRKERPGRILCFLFLIFCLTEAVIGIYRYQKQQKPYEFVLTSPEPLTEEIAEQIADISGVEIFSPVLQMEVTLEINQYKAAVMLTGVNFSVYPVEYEAWVSRLEKGNKPVIFLGKNCFTELQDRNGKRISEQEAQALISETKRFLGDGTYNQKEFSLKLGVGEKDVDITAGGILLSPDNEILMNYEDLRMQMTQMAEDTHVRQAWIRVNGLKNTIKVQEILSAAGMTFDRNYIPE